MSLLWLELKLLMHEDDILAAKYRIYYNVNMPIHLCTKIIIMEDTIYTSVCVFQGHALHALYN